MARPSNLAESLAVAAGSPLRVARRSVAALPRRGPSPPNCACSALAYMRMSSFMCFATRSLPILYDNVGGITPVGVLADAARGHWSRMQPSAIEEVR